MKIEASPVSMFSDHLFNLVPRQAKKFAGKSCGKLGHFFALRPKFNHALKSIFVALTGVVSNLPHLLFKGELVWVAVLQGCRGVSDSS